MTQNRDLKRRVRERQALTGESYVTALRHVRAAAPQPLSVEPCVPSVPIIELIDLTEIAEVLGLRCRVAMYPDLLDRIDVSATLLRFRSALHQPHLETMRSVVVHGAPLHANIELGDALAVQRRIREGRAAVSSNGHIVAINVEGKREPVLVVFMLWLAPSFVQTPAMQPRLILTSVASWRQP